MKKILLFSGILMLSLLHISCTGSKESSKDMPAQTESTGEGEKTSPSTNLLLEKTRTQLSDSYASWTNDIPEAFQRVPVNREVERNIYEGFRIQIYSGENVADADTVAGRFRVWADSTMADYQPETYVFFKTPYYRVHVGDFHHRDKAEKFSRIVKRYFREAWVVYDEVDPSYVPADTVLIRTR